MSIKCMFGYHKWEIVNPKGPQLGGEWQDMSEKKYLDSKEKGTMLRKCKRCGKKQW